MTAFQQSRLAKILSLLTAHECKEFDKWLHSPWANSNKKLPALFKLLQKHHPGFTSSRLSKEALFKKLYPGKEYDDKWIRNIMGALSRQVEKFLVHQRVNNDKLMAKQFLAKEFLERHQGDWFEKETNMVIQELEKKEVKETEDYLQLALIHEGLYHRPGSPLTLGQNALQIADLYLNTFFTISKWRNITELNERQIFLLEENNVFEKINLINSLVKNLDIPVVGIYQGRHEFSKSLTIENYFQFKEKVFSQFEKLPVMDRKLLIFYLINSVIRLWLKGEVSILEELMKLYKIGIENELLMHFGRISETTYSNIVITGNSLKVFSYINDFIEKYTDRLNPAQKEDGKTWALGHLSFKKGDFEKCIQLLSFHNFHNHHFSIFSKSLLLQSYYEACLIDDTYFLFFNDFSEAFKKYIKRDKVLSSGRKIHYLNFIKYTGKLLKICFDQQDGHNAISSFLSQINNEKNIQAKEWLLIKIEEIKKELPG